MATPSLAMIPSGYKASKVYSVLPESGVGDFDFTRATTATRINSSGLIEEMAINVPRLEYPLIDGVVNGCPSLLLEPQSTNLVTYSEDFSNAAWNKRNSSITSNITTSPNGTNNASKLVEDSSNSTHLIFLYSQPQNNSYSVFAKKGEKKWILLTSHSTSAPEARGQFFDLENGIVGNGGDANGKIEDYGNGWYRCSTEANAASSLFTVMLAEGDGVFSYQGNGTDGVYIYGAQHTDTNLSSYIPTNGSATTRNAETCNGAGDAATFNDSEGVLFLNTAALSNDGTSRRISISDETNTNRIFFSYEAASNSIRMYVVAGGSNVVDRIVYISDTTNFNKIILKYKQNDFSLWVNGFELSTDTSGVSFPTNTLKNLSFNGAAGGQPFYGNTKQIQYYNSVLTESELEKLTSWTSFSDMANGQQYTII